MSARVRFYIKAVNNNSLLLLLFKVESAASLMVAFFYADFKRQLLSGPEIVYSTVACLLSSSVQFKMVSMRSEKIICAPPGLSKVFPTSPLKQFQCSSD